MSYDLKTTLSACDHFQLAERYVVSPTDLRTLLYRSNSTLRMRAPINGVALVRVYVGGQLVASDHPQFGYRILPDELSIVGEEQRSKIVFNYPVRLQKPLIEVSYITRRPWCLKCNGAGRLNDLLQANSGSVVHIVGLPKLVQKCFKFILTSVCPFYPSFTCPLKGYLGRKFAPVVTTEDVSFAVTQALDNVKRVQAAQRTVQHLDPQEILKDIVSVDAQSVHDDPTTVRVAAKVSSYGANQPAAVNFTMRTRN